MAVLISDISYRQHRLRAQRSLNTDAVLIADRQFVLLGVQPGDVSDRNRGYECSAGYAAVRIRQENAAAIERDRRTKRNVGTGVVHVVALNALVHGADPATDDRPALPG